MENNILIKPLVLAAIFFAWSIKLALIKWFVQKVIKLNDTTKIWNFIKGAIGIIIIVTFIGGLIIIPLIGKYLNPTINNLIHNKLFQVALTVYFFIHGSVIYKNVITYIYTLIFGSKNSKKKKEDVKKNNEETITFNASNPIAIENIYRGLMVSGGAGSGKSASFVYPILNQIIQKGFTGVIYDYKSPELISFIKRAAIYHNYPYKLITIDFKKPSSSNRLNLLEGLMKVTEAKQLSSSLWKNLNKSAIKDGGSFWNSSAENVLTATFFTLLKNHSKQATIPHALAILLSYSLDDLVEFLSQNNQAKGLVSQLISSYKLGASNQTSGVIGTLTNYISVLNTPENFWILSGKNNPIPNSEQEPSIMLLGNDSTLSDSITPILAMICTTTIMRMNKPNQLKSMVVIDELPTIFLPTLKQLPAVARSNKIATCVTVQDKAQLEDTYGEQETKVILSNLGSQFFGRSTLEATNKYISNLFGKHDVNYKSTSKSTSGGLKSMSGSSSTSYSVQQRNRIEPQMISNFAPGEFCGMIAEGSPKEFTSNKVAMFDTSEIDAIELSEVPRASDSLLEENFDRIYQEVYELKASFLKVKSE